MPKTLSNQDIHHVGQKTTEIQWLADGTAQ